MESFDVSQLFSVEGLVCVVTGGGTGIGLYISSALARNGAIVYIVGRRKEKLDQAVKMHEFHIKGRLIPLVADITSKDDLQRIAAQVEKEQGYINLLIANSGIGGPRINNKKPEMMDDIAKIQQALWDIDPNDFQKTFMTNITGVYFTTVAFLSLLHAGNKKMLEKTGYSSQVVVMSSIAGYSKQLQSSMAYSVSKAAATHLARNFATYFSNLKIRFNVIVPGLYPSELTGASQSDEKGHISMEGKQHLWEDVPLQRAGMEREIAGLAMFLASPSGGYLDGAVIVTDGGRLCIRPSVF